MVKRIKLMVGALVSAIALALASGIAVASAVPQETECPQGSHSQGNNCKVTICHRTDAVKNPYTKPDVDISSVDGDLGNDNGQGDHFAEHTGPVATSESVAQALKDDGKKWGDIIPPVEGVEPGLNWTAEGQAIYRNGCNYVTPGQGGGGGGGTTTPTTKPTPTLTTPQVTTVPQGAVAAGGGGGTGVSAAAAVGIGGSLLSVLSGMALSARRKL